MINEESLAMQPLNKEEIRNINADGLGPGLDENGYYALAFIFNDSRNRAADPIPFKIATRAQEKLARSAIGRPFILGPNPAKHVRGAAGSSKPEEIIKMQKKYAIGEIVRQFTNPTSRNTYGIINIFPEFVDAVASGRIPQYTSPLIEVLDSHAGEILDGRVLHLQAVSSPGYEPEIAKIHAACEGMLNECMTELRTLGAAGRLAEWRKHANESINMDSLSIDWKAVFADTVEPAATTSQEKNLPSGIFIVEVEKHPAFVEMKNKLEEERNRRTRVEKDLLALDKKASGVVGATSSDDEKPDYAAIYESILGGLDGRQKDWKSRPKVDEPYDFFDALKETSP